MDAVFGPLAHTTGNAPRTADDEHVRLVLADGRRLVVRPLRPDDADAEQAFVLALSPASRYQRFHVGLQQLPPSLLRALTHIDQRRHVAIVACAEGDETVPRIVGDARYVVGPDPCCAELAVAVADGWQRAGLGRELLLRLLRRAADDGLHQLVGRVLWDNRAMIAMVRRLGGRLVAMAGDPGGLRAVIETSGFESSNCCVRQARWVVRPDPTAGAPIAH